jgi:endonuclease/exonuclease/phosphatase family metal-dependent hydrolase
MRVLTWNLWHGRSMPAAGRSLAGEFAAMIAAWDWDVALLQEVPPWWPSQLASAARAQARTALTSRNSLLPVRRALAMRRPDWIKSNGGGSNAILVRGEIVEYAAVRLRLWPERRVAQLARLGDGVCVANFHGSASVALAEAELERLWQLALAWAGREPLVLGGDLNLRTPTTGSSGAVHAGRRDVDHVFAHGLEPSGEAELLPREVRLGKGSLVLSDHLPLMVSVGPAG